MTTRVLKLFAPFLVASLLIGACSNQKATPVETGNPTDIPVVKSSGGIVAEGKLVPNQFVELSFSTSGKIAEILVKEGDQIKAGEPLARLANRESVEAQIATAVKGLSDANQEFKNLNDNYVVDRANALNVIADANRAVRDATYQRDNYLVPSDQINLTAADAVTSMKERLDKAYAAFKPYQGESSGDKTREDLKDALDNAQSAYDSAIRRLELETTLEKAKAELQKAQNDYENLKGGPNPDKVTAIQNQIRSAEAALASAKAMLSNLELVSSINGTVIEIKPKTGEEVNANQVVITVADINKWYVETDNLTELDVVNITLGQKAKVVADALPNVTMNGVVDKINQKFEEKRGDTTYTTRVLLEEVDPRLRWGMTVLITFVQ